MTEYRYVTLRTTTDQLVPPRAGAIKSLTIDYLGSVPELAEHMDGWEVINSQVIPIEDDVLLVLLLKAEVSVPDLD